MAAKLVCFGELLIDFVALERDTSVGYANRFEKAAGGAPANVAVGLAKLGNPTAFITQVGDDPFGHFLAETVAAHGVDIAGIVFSKEARTALAFVAVEASGERTFAFYRNPSADMLMTPDALHRELIESTPLFHFGSITLIDDPVRQTTLQAVDMARQHGAVISYDPNLREVLWPSTERARLGIQEGFQVADLVKMNDGELRFLHQRADIQSKDEIVAAARALFHDKLKLMVITLGAEGCIALTQDAHWHVEGFSVTVEDTIGAGDGFMAGLLSGIAGHMDGNGWPAIAKTDVIEPILRQANAVGALTASRRGGIPALPTATEVDAFLKK